MKEFVVFYRHYIARLKGSVVEHIDVNAHTKEEALEVAKPLLPKDATLIRADESPTWSVDK